MKDRFAQQMSIKQLLAKNLRDAYHGPNWTAVSLKDALEGVFWEQATTKVGDLNTIVSLVFHIDYYINAVVNVLQGGSLEANDKYSFEHPEVNSEEDWQALIGNSMNNVEMLAGLIENMDENLLSDDFTVSKYGSYFRNLNGVIEHVYYHAGQISLIKKLLMQSNMKEKK